MRKKACRRCKLFVTTDSCPVCGGDNFSTNWKGRLFIIDPEKSFIAKKVGISKKGEYAIKVP